MFQYGLHATVCFPDVFCPVIYNKAFSLTAPPSHPLIFLHFYNLTLLYHIQKKQLVNYIRIPICLLESYLDITLKCQQWLPLNDGIIDDL